MSTWISERDAELIGLGVDTEDCARFRPEAEPWTWSDVFSPAELAHARATPDAARALCAAFCVKEALRKALGAPYAPDACELRLAPDQEAQDVTLAPALRRRHAIGAVDTRVTFDATACVAVVHLYGPG